MIIYISSKLGAEPIGFTSHDALMNWLDKSVNKGIGVNLEICVDGQVFLGNRQIGRAYHIKPIA